MKQAKKKSSSKSKAFTKYAKVLNATPFRALLVLVVCGLIFMLTHSIQAGSLTNPNLSLSPRTAPKAKKITPVAVKPKPTGPMQTDPDFSTYPTWSQDFSDYGSKTLSKRYWNINVGPPDNNNNEAEYYTNKPTNLRISNGSLVMEATQVSEPDDLNYASSRIDTSNKMSFLYGRIDVVAKLPAGIGTWPAVWFLPANNKYEDMSPASDVNSYLNGGEMDMIEEVGSSPNLVYGIVHTLEASDTNANGVGDYNVVNVEDSSSQYYLYTLLWTPNSITFEINNTPFFTYARPTDSNYKTWPFDQPFYMIMNLALGGSWGGEDTTDFPGNGIDNSALPTSMDIQSIYYYSYKSTSN